ncbi:hypothetical protein L6164_003511 [Bauhinia variegata]|uniref:Uncharacterized protein n=1 Tax=Bauhinia variegata TaxID=167791 RepID=A0ACB9Q3I9_BAUVA|nr:hypothetical protein L6164_003511 [Bauhinia variegata]
MRAAPAPESSSAAALPPKTCDVFINFRIEDTIRSLVRYVVRTEMTRIADRLGEIEQLRVECIEKSRVAVGIYSENYDYPKWCLDEVAGKMACKKTEQNVIPVFYNIDPSLVAQGLGYLHASTKQIIYRDFKCSNILLDGAYNAKLSDFGLAKFDFHGDTESMALGGFASNNKDEVTSKLINDANKASHHICFSSSKLLLCCH